MRYAFFVTAIAVLTITACNGKPSQQTDGSAAQQNDSINKRDTSTYPATKDFNLKTARGVDSATAVMMIDNARQKKFKVPAGAFTSFDANDIRSILADTSVKGLQLVLAAYPDSALAPAGKKKLVTLLLRVQSVSSGAGLVPKTTYSFFTSDKLCPLPEDCVLSN